VREPPTYWPGKPHYRYVCDEGHLTVAPEPRTRCALERRGKQVCWAQLTPQESNA
jgi:hypothetical protein